MSSPLPAGPIDLHTHSSVSDGTEAPAELIRAASAAGLGVVALTDHDSTAGWAEATDSARELGIALIPGMELSTRVERASIHLLGYLMDPAHPGLVAETARIREGRRHRAESIVRRLSVDYDLSWDDVLEQTVPGGTVGRPHIADALVARGFVASRSIAFETILHWRGGYFQPHYAPDPLTGVRLVRAAGGVPVLAHPGTAGRSRVIDEEHLAELVDAGLFGLEIDHRENTRDGKERLHELARRFDLAVTGSSDYHGSGKPNRLAENSTAPAVLDAILATGTGSAAVLP